jgi:nucleoside-diphosphate-sugar epimerase
MAGDLVLVSSRTSNLEKTQRVYSEQITGVSGHIGFCVLATALGAGYRVRATVRRAEQIDIIRATKSIRPFSDTLDMVVVPDILKDGAFDDVLNGVKYVIHVASPMGREVREEEP